MKYKDTLVKDLLALGYSDNDLAALFDEVRLKRAKHQNEEKKLAVKKNVEKVPKKKLNEFLRRARKLIKGKKVTYPSFTITFKVSEKLAWEEETYVQPSNINIQILKKGTNFTPPYYNYLKDHIIEMLRDFGWDFPSREKEMKKLNQEIKTLLKEMKQCESSLGLQKDTIWEYIERKVYY
jgi:hypothetical protein